MQENAKLLFLAVLIPLSTDLTTAYPGRNGFLPICFRKHGVLVPMYGSCSGFFICVEGNAIASSCGSFYRFNVETRHCDHPEHVDCDQRQTIDEPDYYDSIMPMFPAVPSTLSPKIPKPQHPDEVVVDESAGDICRRKPNGELLPKIDSCTHFYVCIEQRPYRRTCPPMLHFNAQRRLCQAPLLAECAVKPMHNTRVLELVKFGGVACAGMPDDILLPHENDCTKFYNCQNERRNELECPVGLHFSVRHQRCELPNLAKCSV